MAQRRQQRRGMAMIPRARRGADIVYQEGADFLHATGMIQQIPGQHGGGDLRHMLMFGDGGDFGIGKAAQADAIIQRDHGSSRGFIWVQGAGHKVT